MTDPTTTTAPVKQPLLPDGTQPLPLGSGTIVSLLGKGGMAVVYRIWNKELGVHRAVKLLRNASDPENLRRFRTEISVTAQLRHPNIVVIHTTGEWQGVPFVEMEEIDGETLDQLLHSWGALPVPVATTTFRPSASRRIASSWWLKSARSPIAARANPGSISSSRISRSTSETGRTLR